MVAYFSAVEKLVMTNNCFPKDLADAVFSDLIARNLPTPPLTALCELFEGLYFASLRTEESQPIRIYVIYLDPDNPDPNPPQRLVNDRWSCARLSPPLPLTVANLIKIATASDPRASAFAVYHDTPHTLTIWGLIDQANRYYDYLNHDADTEPERPGTFQAAIVGTGHLAAYIGYEKIAELRTNVLLRGTIDALRRGPLHGRLERGVETYIQRVRAAIPAAIYYDRAQWGKALEADWISSLCRVLLRMQSYRHGGALLLTPDASSDGLNVKYGINYSRLRTALERRARLGIYETYASDQIFEHHIEPNKDDVSMDLYVNESFYGAELQDCHSELEGAVGFISLLSRVDGLVLMNPDLDVCGFGVEIVVDEPPRSIWRATDPSAQRAHQESADYNYFGTRHRSMMRYCARFPGSVGFVVSQDGDVRAMTQVRNRLVYWDNLTLQHEQRKPRKRMA
jgi:hypothetical protein